MNYLNIKINPKEEDSRVLLISTAKNFYLIIQIIRNQNLTIRNHYRMKKVSSLSKKNQIK